MIYGNENYNGISYYVMDAVTDVTKYEKEVKDKITGAQGRLDRACKRDKHEAREKDIKHLHKLACQVYKSVTGEKFTNTVTHQRRSQCQLANKKG